MNYELLTTINTESVEWLKIKDIININSKDCHKLLQVLPNTSFNDICIKENISGINVFNYLTELSFNIENTLYFNKAPVPDKAEIFMNSDFSISILHDGIEIGIVNIFPGTRRHVESIHYFQHDGDIDYIEEYTTDGKKFSEIFYFNGKPQEVHFYNENNIAVISYFLYNGDIEYVTYNSKDNGNILNGFHSLDDFLSYQVSNIVSNEDVVNIYYMGRELDILSKSQSYNIFNLIESPVDENGDIKLNLENILTNKISFIHQVKMSEKYKKIIIDNGLPSQKIIVQE